MDQADFDREPPFPEHLPLADLEVISLGRLLDASDEDETQKLFDACKRFGFFYLRLDDSDTGTQLLQIVKQMFQLQTQLFDLPLDEKQKYDIHDQGSFFGYSAPGATVIDRRGTRDRMEVWNVCYPPSSR
jgi:isopenicillin N synthase-like dioxygenase